MSNQCPVLGRADELADRSFAVLRIAQVGEGGLRPAPRMPVYPRMSTTPSLTNFHSKERASASQTIASRSAMRLRTRRSSLPGARGGVWDSSRAVWTERGHDAMSPSVGAGVRADLERAVGTANGSGAQCPSSPRGSGDADPRDRRCQARPTLGAGQSSSASDTVVAPRPGRRPASAGTASASDGDWSEVGDPDQVRRVDLRLAVPAHRAEDSGRAAVPMGDRRHQGVRRPLPGREHVRVAADPGRTVRRGCAGRCRWTARGCPTPRPSYRLWIRLRRCPRHRRSRARSCRRVCEVPCTGGRTHGARADLRR